MSQQFALKNLLGFVRKLLSTSVLSHFLISTQICKVVVCRDIIRNFLPTFSVKKSWKPKRRTRPHFKNGSQFCIWFGWRGMKGKRKIYSNFHAFAFKCVSSAKVFSLSHKPMNNKIHMATTVEGRVKKVAMKKMLREPKINPIS